MSKLVFPHGNAPRGRRKYAAAIYWAITANASYPWGHLMCVRVAMVIVENKNCEDHTAGNHALDKVEICPCNKNPGI